MFRFTNINEYQAALLAGEQTCAQAVQFYLDQIAQHQDLNAYLEARHGVNVFNSQDLNQCSDEPVLYFFPRRVFKLKKVIPPSPAQ